MKNCVPLILALITITPSRCELLKYYDMANYSMAQIYIADDNPIAENISETKIDKKIFQTTVNHHSLTAGSLIRMAQFQSYGGTLSVAIISRSTHDTIFIGKSTNDTIVFNDGLKFASGQNGADIYKVVTQSPKYIWINNFAEDNALDTLEVPTEIIDYDADFYDSVAQKSEFHIILGYCNSVYETKKFVILKNYLKDDLSRHLRLKTSTGDFSMFVPAQWLPSNSNGSYEANDLHDMYSLKDSIPLPQSLPIWSHDSFPIFNVYDQNCTFELRNNTNDSFVTNLYINDGRGNAEALYVRLVHFYENGVVSNAWRDKYFIVVYDDNTPHKILTVNDLLSSLSSLEH